MEQELYKEANEQDFEAEDFSEETGFELVDVAGFSDYIEDDGEVMTISSLSEIKKRRAEQEAKNNK